MRVRNCLLTAVVLCAAGARGLTTIQIQTNVVVRDTIHLGLNLTGNNYYDSPTLRVRDTKNFEGATYRQCHEGTKHMADKPR